MKKLLFLIFLPCLFGQAEASNEELANLEIQDSLSSATKETHGMILFGNSPIYMYHLPMWGDPHPWHLILEVELDRKALSLYQADQAAGSSLQSFRPEPFELAQLKPGYKILGKIYHGHFEQGGQALPTSSSPAKVTATVKRILTVKHLDPDGASRSSAVYRIFGSDGEYFAAHLPSRAPDFDQVLAVAAGAGCSIPEQVLNGMTVKFQGIGNTINDRPRPGAEISASNSGGLNFCLTMKGEPYFSTRDLGK
jgi:hypothetical protein